MAQELPTGIKLFNSNDNVSRQAFNANFQVINDKLIQGESTLVSHLADFATYVADNEYPLATVVGQQIQVTHESDSTVYKFKLAADVTGGAITISEDGGGSDLPLLDIDGDPVTDLDKGFVEVIKDVANFTLRPRGAKVLDFMDNYAGTELTLLENVPAGYYVYSNEKVSLDLAINENIKLLLHLNGANGSTTFTDAELVPKTVTSSGAAQINTAQSKFGGASGYFGSNGYLTIPNSPDFNVGTSGDFIIDFWYYPTRWPNIGSPAGSGYNGLLFLGSSTSDTDAVKLEMGVGSGEGKATLTLTDWTTTLARFIDAITELNRWYHIRIRRRLGVWSIFLDGVKCELTSSVSKNITGKNIYIGFSYRWDGGTNQFYIYSNGYVDEFLFKNTSDDAESFTLPTEEYSAYTGQLIPSINETLNKTQLQVVTAGSLKTYGTERKYYAGFASKDDLFSVPMVGSYYNLGEEFTEVTGGWVIGYSAGTGSFTKYPTYLEIAATSYAGWMLAIADVMVDLTNINTLYIDWESNSANAYLFTGTTRDVGGDAQIQKTVGAFSRVTESLDVSALTGYYHLKVGANCPVSNTTVKLHRLWGE